MKNSLIISASPKKKGNSASVAQCIKDYFETHLHAQTAMSGVLFLSDYNINHCTDCKYCKTNSACVHDVKDDAHFLFEACREADNIILVTPIYFYHAPSQLKAFIDRSQKYWYTEHNIDKKFYAVYVCAREKGEKLSLGLDLTLKYFAPLIGAQFEQSLCLFGLEEKDDFHNSQNAQEKVSEFMNSISLNFGT